MATTTEENERAESILLRKGVDWDRLSDEEMMAIDILDTAALDADTDDWVEQEISLPPYWKPFWVKESKKGNGFRGIILAKDVRDPNFQRYVIQATVPILCFRGPADTAERIIVKPGQRFTCSAYAALPLERFFAMEVKIMVRLMRKLKGNEESKEVPRNFFEFKASVSPSDAQQLRDEMKGLNDQLKEKRKEARAQAMAFLYSFKSPELTDEQKAQKEAEEQGALTPEAVKQQMSAVL